MRHYECLRTRHIESYPNAADGPYLGADDSVKVSRQKGQIETGGIDWLEVELHEKNNTHRTPSYPNAADGPCLGTKWIQARPAWTHTGPSKPMWAQLAPDLIRPSWHAKYFHVFCIALIDIWKRILASFRTIFHQSSNRINHKHAQRAQCCELESLSHRMIKVSVGHIISTQCEIVWGPYTCVPQPKMCREFAPTT